PLRMFIAGGLVSAVGVCQPVARFPFAPVPNDPFELINGGISIPDSPDQRLAAQQIIVKARDQYKLHAGSPFDLKATFNATGQSLYEGPGMLEELFLGMNGSRWTAQLGNYSQTRITGTMGLVYDIKSGSQIFMRLQQLRQAIFSPIYANPQTAFIRAAVVSLNNEELTCVLLSHGSVEPPATTRRRWDETEWCVNSQSGRLRIASEVPGAYTVYDYTDSIQFHDLTLPRNITVTEAGAKVLDIRIDSVTDPASLDRKQLAPAAGMVTGGPVFHDSVHLIRGVPDGSQRPPTVVKPVIVHATFGPGGNPMEMEVAASSDPSLNSEALNFAKRFRYEIPPPPGAVPEQSQVFLTVRFFSR
ncbi:MAG TPA: hypothetical protein VGL82_10365, partial [Bryobacteraceae bacterium]